MSARTLLRDISCDQKLVIQMLKHDRQQLMSHLKLTFPILGKEIATTLQQIIDEMNRADDVRLREKLNGIMLDQARSHMDVEAEIPQ